MSGRYLGYTHRMNTPPTYDLRKQAPVRAAARTEWLLRLSCSLSDSTISALQHVEVEAPPWLVHEIK
jgi:hypothetical protein